MIRGERNPAMGQGQGENIGVRIGFIILLFFFIIKIHLAIVSPFVIYFTCSIVSFISFSLYPILL